MQKPYPIQENQTHKIIRDFEMRMDSIIHARRREEM